MTLLLLCRNDIDTIIRFGRDLEADGLCWRDLHFSNASSFNTYVDKLVNEHGSDWKTAYIPVTVDGWEEHEFPPAKIVYRDCMKLIRELVAYLAADEYGWRWNYTPPEVRLNGAGQPVISHPSDGEWWKEQAERARRLSALLLALIGYSDSAVLNDKQTAKVYPAYLVPANVDWDTFRHIFPLCVFLYLPVLSPPHPGARHVVI